MTLNTKMSINIKSHHPKSILAASPKLPGRCCSRPVFKPLLRVENASSTNGFHYQNLTLKHPSHSPQEPMSSLQRSPFSTHHRHFSSQLKCY